ncbi:MAG: ATP phosphoribosyltransferase regulatory subunit [Lachnospiraceae bacterium]|nr:ATP phosphoribosyltransferase regulatory subunit [Lachnospiraceae bacterium]
MKTDYIHTPEGVRDIYGEEYDRKIQIQNRVHSRIREYGYRDIQTPTFEFLEIFGKEIGTTPVKDLYKFFDSDGNILCLRPDFTPSIVRSAVKYFSREELPLRFSYQGNTFANTSLLQGKLKETTQMGVELMGDPSVEAEGEIISLVTEALLSTGLCEFQISIGQVDFFSGICREHSLHFLQEEKLRVLISNKNYLAAEEFLRSEGFPEEVIRDFMKIEDLFGSVEVLNEAACVASHPKSQEAIRRLRLLYDVLTAYGVEKYVSFDLGMLSSYQYYTGIIFKVYTYGIGDVVAKGGRYDRLLPKFGKDSSAIGFVVLIDDLMQALDRQKIEIPTPADITMILYSSQMYGKALRRAGEMRKAGKKVLLTALEKDKTPEEYEAYARRQGICEIIMMDGGQEG